MKRREFFNGLAAGTALTTLMPTTIFVSATAQYGRVELNLAEIITTTLNNYADQIEGVLADNVISNNALLERLKAKA